jgi:hypothetical protein
MMKTSAVRSCSWTRKDCAASLGEFCRTIMCDQNVTLKPFLYIPIRENKGGGNEIVCPAKLKVLGGCRWATLRNLGVGPLIRPRIANETTWISLGKTALRQEISNGWCAAI